MFTSFSLSPLLRRGLSLAIFTGAGFAVAGAQTAAPSDQGVAMSQLPSFETAAVPAFVSSLSAPAYSSSSGTAYDPAETAQTQLASLEKSIGLPGTEAMQYGQRRRYGAPRYRGGNTNADGSEKYTVYAGGGLAAPASTNFNYGTTSWGAQVGVGRNFNKNVGLNAEFDYDHFGMNGTTLTNQQDLYNYIITYYSGSGNDVSGLDGNSHVWSFTLDPSYTLKSGEGLGAYVIGGAGFYHKVANFTLPSQGTYCDYYGFCYSYVSNQVVDHYTSNALGVNGGLGLTYKFSRFANERLFAEVRYVYIFNSARAGVTASTVSASNVAYPNDFPQNSNRTGYLPVKFGIRF